MDVGLGQRRGGSILKFYVTPYMFTHRIRDHFLTSTPKPAKFSRDQIPSRGRSGEEKRWKQITLLTVIKIFIGCASPFFAETGKWNLISGKNLWFWDWDQKIVANSARQHTEPVSELQFRQKRQHWETHHQIRENF
jgi:hypothetical protein